MKKIKCVFVLFFLMLCINVIAQTPPPPPPPPPGLPLGGGLEVLLVAGLFYAYKRIKG